jgi:hypothetical protein
VPIDPALLSAFSAFGALIGGPHPGSDDAPTSVVKAIADCVTTPKAISPFMKTGATIKAGMIWIIQLCPW